MKSNKRKTTIQPIDGKYIIIKEAAKCTAGKSGDYVETSYGNAKKYMM